MPATPDPLANNPAVRAWAERFFAVKAWPMPDPTAPEDGAVAKRRAELLTELDGIVIGPDLSPGARRSFAGGRKTIRKELGAAPDIPALNIAGNDIARLRNDVEAQRLVAVARAKAQGALAIAQERFLAGRAGLDQGGFTYLNTLLGAAQKAMSAAVSRTDFDAVETQAKDFLPRAEAATEFGAYFDRWVKASLLFLKGLTEPDLGTRTGARTKALADAATRTTTGDFVGAKGLLEGWQNSGGVNVGEFDAALEFERTLMEYHATHAALCERVVQSFIDDAKARKDDVGKAERLAYQQGKFADARQTIDDLVAYCTPRDALAAYLKRIGQVSNSMPTLRDALKEMQTKQKTDPTAALDGLKKFFAANKEIENQNFSVMVVKSLQSRYDALMKIAREPLKTELQALWLDHSSKVATKDFDGAAKLLPTLNVMFRFEKTVDGEATIARVLHDHPAAAGYGLDSTYANALAAKNWSDALKAVPGTAERMTQLAAYLVEKQAVEEVLALLPGDPATLRQTLSDAIATAELTARTDPSKARADLLAVMNGTDYLGLALEIADFRDKLAAVAKEHARTLKYIPVPAAAKALQDSFDAARDIGDTAHRFGDAFLALEQHLRLLREAAAMGTARTQVVGIIGALKRSGTDVASYEARAGDAEKEAAKPDFAKAQVMFERLLKDMEGDCRTAATQYENDDKAGCNAGHSLARHGYDVKPMDLIGRLTTGTPPNPDNPDEKSYTQMSTKFESPQDWLAGREVAAEAAKNLPPGKRVDIDAKTLPYDEDPLTAPAEKADFVVDHGRPIDRGFVGRKKQMEMDGGVLKESKCYETFEEVEGLTRAYVNFIWVPDLFAAETIDQNGTLVAFPEAQVADNKAYAAEYQKRHLKKPASVPGRWVMMQHFPVADGWDNERKVYVNQPDTLIP